MERILKLLRARDWRARNVWKDGGWLYAENRTYTGSDSLDNLGAGDYRLYAWANNTLGFDGSDRVRFFVQTMSLTVKVHPETLNIKSKGRWVTVQVSFPGDLDVDDLDLETVELEVDGKGIAAKWARVGDGVLMVKFSREELKEIIDGLGDVEIHVRGSFEGGSSFEGSDTIRIIYPGKHQSGPQHQWKGSQGKKNSHKDT